MNEVYEDAINYLKYYGEKNCGKVENIAYFLDCELKNYIKLQSNWNSLREWLKDLIIYEEMEDNTYYLESIQVLQDVLDKMNELEGVDN